MDGWTGAQEIRPKLFEQAFFSLSAAAQVEHRHPARSQHKRCELLRFPQAARPQRFQRGDQNLLRQIRPRRVRLSSDAIHKAGCAAPCGETARLQLRGRFRSRFADTNSASL